MGGASFFRKLQLKTTYFTLKKYLVGAWSVLGLFVFFFGGGVGFGFFLFGLGLFSTR